MIRDRRSRASRRGLLLLTAYLASRSSLALADEVRLLEATTMDWPEGRLSIEAELSAAGHKVTSVPSAALDPEALLAELVAEETTSYSASATVVRIGRSGIAYVCFRGSKDIFRVTSSDVDPTRAAHLLSLRVAELIALRDRGRERDPSPAPPPPQKAKTPPPPPQRSPERYSRPKWEIDGGAVALFSSGLSEPLFEVKAGLGRRFGSWFAAEARGTWSLLPSRKTFPEGTLQVESRSLGLGAFARLDGLFGDDDGAPHFVSPRVGARALLACFEITGLSSDTTTATTACSLGLALSARVDFGISDHLSLWLGAEGSFTAPPVRVLSDGAPIATLAQPNLGLDAGVAWLF